MADKSVWKNIKSVFVVEDEELVKKASNTKANQKTVPNKQSAVVQESSKGSPGKVTSKFVNVLLGAMEQANLDGFDYLEYKQSLNSLAKMPMDVKTRFQSAFAMAQTMGANPKKLMDSALHYINVLKKEEVKFEKALAKQIEEKIGNRKGQIEQFNNVIQEKAKQIKQLTQEIEAHQNKIVNLEKEISSSTQKVESTKNDFIASYNKLVNQIQEDVENMKQFLK